MHLVRGLHFENSSIRSAERNGPSIDPGTQQEYIVPAFLMKRTQVLSTEMPSLRYSWFATLNSAGLAGGH